ncbi:MAG: hypothetical protein H6739_26665 [Alphaproteobacteria bacterium]|nr:hypothetical protein [Alphaproteobacteria bacterium]
MRHALPLLTLLAACSTPQAMPLAAPAEDVASPPPTAWAADQGFVVHEWGTFTAVAGQDGAALDWRPLSGPSDLPLFVYGPGRPAGRGPVPTKGNPVPIRMETPVLYFYSDRPMGVSVKVDFPQGQVTEWYPHANHVNRGIDWGAFQIRPDKRPTFRHDGRESHYYPARETAAAPVLKISPASIELERFLFYRGVADFDLQVDAVVEGDAVRAWLAPGPRPERLLVFERQGDRLGLSHVDIMDDELMLQRPELDATLPEVLSEVEALLVDTGLYQDEAHAMVKTWRDDWFTEGLRLIWVLPPDETDTHLPLRIKPEPDAVVRTLVGRLELMDEGRLGRLNEILDSAQGDAQAVEAVRAEGRFAEPGLTFIAQGQGPRAERAARLLEMLRQG